MRRSKLFALAPAVFLAAVLVASSSGCSRFSRYVGSFGAVGAAVGGGVGATTSASVNAGEGALMGAAGGGLVGALVADHFDESDWESMEAEIARLRGEVDDQAAMLAAKDGQLRDREMAFAAMAGDLDDERARRDGMANEIAALRADLADRDGRLASLQNDLSIRQVALENANSELDGLRDRLGADVEVSGGNGSAIALTILDDIIFRSGSAELSKDGARLLSEVADTLREQYPDREFVIEGHTDSSPIARSGWKSNWELGSARALAVLHHLVSNERLPKEQVAALTRAETRPVASNSSPEGRARNRRAVILIMPPLTTAPAFSDVGQEVTAAYHVEEPAATMMTGSIPVDEVEMAPTPIETSAAPDLDPFTSPSSVAYGLPGSR